MSLEEIEQLINETRKKLFENRVEVSTKPHTPEEKQTFQREERELLTQIKKLLLEKAKIENQSTQNKKGR